MKTALFACSHCDATITLTDAQLAIIRSGHLTCDTLRGAAEIRVYRQLKARGLVTISGRKYLYTDATPKGAALRYQVAAYDRLVAAVRVGGGVTEEDARRCVAALMRMGRVNANYSVRDRLDRDTMNEAIRRSKKASLARKVSAATR